MHYATTFHLPPKDNALYTYASVYGDAGEIRCAEGYRGKEVDILVLSAKCRSDCTERQGLLPSSRCGK